jgi:hypothetical protein
VCTDRPIADIAAVVPCRAKRFRDIDNSDTAF